MKDKLKGLLFNSKIRGYTNKNLAKYTLSEMLCLRKTKRMGEKTLKRKGVYHDYGKSHC